MRHESDRLQHLHGAYRRGRVRTVPQAEPRRRLRPAAPDLPDREPPGGWPHLVRANPGAAAAVRRGGKAAVEPEGPLAANADVADHPTEEPLTADRAHLDSSTNPS